MKIESGFVKYIMNHRWGFAGFLFIIIMGFILWNFTGWRLGDIIAILAILSSLYIMLYNGRRTEIRFQKLINENEKNTLRRIIGPERRKELIIFAEDLEVLYYKSQTKRVPLEIIVEELKNREEVSNEFLEDFFSFLKYTSNKVTTHNLSATLKILIFNEFVALEENINRPIAEISSDEREAIIDLAINIYGEVTQELNNPKNEFEIV